MRGRRRASSTGVLVAFLPVLSGSEPSGFVHVGLRVISDSENQVDWGIPVTDVDVHTC